MSKKCPLTVWLLVLTAIGIGRAEAGLVLTADAVGVQASTLAGVTTETFDNDAAGKTASLVTAIGTITSPDVAIMNADQYGGANATGRYIAIGAESGSLTMTLTLKSPQAYFGLWWSAADAGNQIEFLSNGQEVASFNSATALGDLSSAYLGNSNNVYEDSSEKFAYLNFIGTQGTTFDQIVFSNLNASTGFESDNWSILSAQVVPPYPGTTIAGGLVNAVPEPTSLVLSSLGILAALGLARRPRR